MTTYKYLWMLAGKINRHDQGLPEYGSQMKLYSFDL